MVHPPLYDVISQYAWNAFWVLPPSGSNQYMPSPLEYPRFLISLQSAPITDHIENIECRPSFTTTTKNGSFADSKQRGLQRKLFHLQVPIAGQHTAISINHRLSGNLRNKTVMCCRLSTNKFTKLNYCSPLHKLNHTGIYRKNKAPIKEPAIEELLQIISHHNINGITLLSTSLSFHI